MGTKSKMKKYLSVLNINTHTHTHTHTHTTTGLSILKNDLNKTKLREKEFDLASDAVQLLKIEKRDKGLFVKLVPKVL